MGYHAKVDLWVGLLGKTFTSLNQTVGTTMDDFRLCHWIDLQEKLQESPICFRWRFSQQNQSIYCVGHFEIPTARFNYQRVSFFRFVSMLQQEIWRIWKSVNLCESRLCLQAVKSSRPCRELPNYIYLLLSIAPKNRTKPKMYFQHLSTYYINPIKCSPPKMCQKKHRTKPFFVAMAPGYSDPEDSTTCGHWICGHILRRILFLLVRIMYIYT